jgi:putative sigma-54 modulation protein
MMELIISSKHFNVSEDLKDFIERKLRKLEEEFDKLTSLRLVLYIERGMHVAEAHLFGKHIEMEAAARTPDMYTTIDAVSEKLERQLRRHIERIREHRVERTAGEAPAVLGDEPEEDFEEQTA